MPETKTKRLDIIYRNGKPTSVILDIDDYAALLDEAEDADDADYLRKLRRKPPEFVSLDELLSERPANV